MLRIVVNTDIITFQLWNQGREKARVYPNTPEYALKLASMIGARKVAHAGTIDTYAHENEAFHTVRPIQKYRIVGGMYFDERTPADLCALLVTMRARHVRLAFTYGDPMTGKIWERDSYGSVGYVGKSTGSKPIPLVVYNRRSYGGGAMLSHCIMQVAYANKSQGGTIYTAPVLRS